MAQLSGVKKAAILMISLGSEASSQVMKLLPDSMIQKVSYEIANTDYVTPEEKNRNSISEHLSLPALHWDYNHGNLHKW